MGRFALGPLFSTENAKKGAGELIAVIADIAVIARDRKGKSLLPRQDRLPGPDIQALGFLIRF
jgi:hypothetical protein